MSDISAPTSDLNLKELVARIDRTQAETAKLAEETRKFVAEQHKLMAEAEKLRRDRGWARQSIIVTIVTASAAIVVSVVSLLKSMGLL